jgi:hypothetical protein
MFGRGLIRRDKGVERDGISALPKFVLTVPLDNVTASSNFLVQRFILNAADSFCFSRARSGRNYVVDDSDY